MDESAARRVAADPSLYDADCERPVLLGVRCSQCTRVYFPPIGIGCESCGAPECELKPARLPAVGTVFAIARVHRHQGSTPTPFTVAEIVLDAGPLIRAMIHPDIEGIQIGQRVESVWYVTGPRVPGRQTVEPALIPAGAA